MAVKKEGKVYDSVYERFKAEGLETEGLAVASLCRGTDHLILINGDIIGEYNSRSKEIFLYKDIIG